MSANTENTPLPVAAQVETEAAEWFQRRQFWAWSTEDQQKLDAWLAQSLAHSVAFWRLEAGFKGTDRLTALRLPRFGDVKTAPARSWSHLLFRAVAAAVLLGVLGTGAVFALRSADPAPIELVYATDIGGSKQIKLADGSSIELNTNTQVRVAISAAQRLITLERGEAYFQVAHDKARPFVVIAGNRRITDLGTKFVVRRGAEHLEIAVTQGRVRLEASDDARAFAPVELIEGEVVIANDKQILVKTKPEKKLAQDLSWRHGVLIFDHTTLGHAAREFNRYNAAKLIVEDPHVASLTIDGTFRSNNVEMFAHAAKDLLGLKIEPRGPDMVISR
ncbi:MAG TPA: FecR domain-containing protein [Rhizomicrobium sp.]|nr:FecR domain-containing protein [Rhizomicrobium sp.]